MEAAPILRQTLGRYQLVRHLASGGMAEVLLARVVGIEGFEHHVVIKRIREKQARDARFVQMFLDEARLAAQLHHHNIVHVHDIGQEDGEYFFAMEYIHGEDIRRLLAHLARRNERVPLEFCVTIALNTAAALHYAHELRSADRKPLGIVHCDVSPANIMLSYDGNVKVCDFGIARVAQRTTETGVLEGKVAYMSPEQCVGAEIDRRSDVFCLGIVLYELVTVRRLFKGPNDFLTMSQITHGEIPLPSGIRPDIPTELEGIILKALASKPADRYQTAAEMRAALERFAARAGYQTSPTALADYMRAQFGERPEPWHVDEDEPEISIDFDGSETGVATAPPEAVERFALPGITALARHAPIVRARKGAITSVPPLGQPASSRRVAPRRRSSIAWLLGGGALAAGIVAVAVERSGAESASVPAGSSSIVAPAAAPSPAPAPEPPRSPAPTADVTAAEPDPIEMKAEPATDDEPRQKRKRGSGKKHPIKGVWDPKGLLPPKKVDRPRS